MPLELLTFLLGVAVGVFVVMIVYLEFWYRKIRALSDDKNNYGGVFLLCAAERVRAWQHTLARMALSSNRQ